MTLAEKKKQFNQILFRWHKGNYREMAWRNTHDPYRILVSEIMLQQTQVERVRTKYVEFLKKFPTIKALAGASLGDVLRVWSGLGYNRRAKYLHECAKRVVGEYGGKFPDNIPALLTLPGIGISTSAALSAFAFNGDEPMIDTNIRRILHRVFFAQKMSRSDLDSKYRVPTDRELYAFAKMLIPTGRGRDWNYAMLDLGATLCTARNHSDDCPLQGLHGRVGDFIYKKPQKKFAHSDRYYRGRILAMLVVEKGTKVKLGKALALDVEKLGALVSKLVSEKLIVMRGQTLHIP